MAKTIATLVGAVFILVGIAGFVSHELLGAHLSTTHNLVHLVSGAASLYFGLKGTLAQARTFCLIFGIVYGLLGVVGFFVGTGEDRLLDIAAIGLRLGTVDHIIHIVIGALYLFGALSTKAGVVEADAR
ncbi:MAG TPA: DUF4383 domain-containing protein [Blastocatellia bacterium]|nr:DUF4383 domain-containing protein [Blastocatellia bacterium]